MYIRNNLFSISQEVWKIKGLFFIFSPSVWELLLVYKNLKPMSGIFLLRYRSARLDLHESGIIGKPFKRTSTAICFEFFYFWSWIFDKSSKFWAASCKNESNLLLVRFTVCIESCLPIGWRTFIWWKNPPKFSSILIWIAEWWNFLPASRNPKNNWCLSRIYGVRFGKKDRSLSTCKPWTEQAGGLMAFLHGAAQNFEVVLNTQDQK